MIELSDTTVIAILIAVPLVVVWGLRNALKRPVDETHPIVEREADGEHRVRAREDGIHLEVAAAFEQEVKVRGRDIRREEGRETETGIGGLRPRFRL